MRYGWPIVMDSISGLIAAAMDSLSFMQSLTSMPNRPPFGKGTGREHVRRRSQLTRSRRRKAKARHA